MHRLRRCSSRPTPWNAAGGSASEMSPSAPQNRGGSGKGDQASQLRAPLGFNPAPVHLLTGRHPDVADDGQWHCSTRLPRTVPLLVPAREGKVEEASRQREVRLEHEGELAPIGHTRSTLSRVPSRAKVRTMRRPPRRRMSEPQPPYSRGSRCMPRSGRKQSLACASRFIDQHAVGFTGREEFNH